ncbi:G-type lectin S-receptor-like serine/threonine-protein kinase [Tanacetum coccineum]
MCGAVPKAKGSGHRIKACSLKWREATRVPKGAPLRVLKLQDTGNVVLIDVASGTTLWQSFNAPTDTFLPGMMMAGDLKLTSWKNVDDPGSGSFEFQPDPGTNRYSILNESTTYLWRSGNMSRNSFDDNQIYSKAFSLLSNSITQKRIKGIFPNGTQYYETYMVIEPYSSCMAGFEPISPVDTTAGCKRSSGICQRSPKDTFLNVTKISMDDTALPLYPANNESVCIEKCLENCQCQAYSFR